jgi:hypothetical protein
VSCVQPPKGSRWPRILVGSLTGLALWIAILDVGPPGDHAGDVWLSPAEVVTPGPGREPTLAVQLSPWTPLELLSRALSGSTSAWHILHAQAADLSRAERSHLRQRLSGELARAVQPTAIYRGGSDAPRLAARLADPELCESLLALLSNWSCVVAQLPLTDNRDDLRVLEAVQEGVAAAGTRAQRARLTALLRIFPSTDSVNLRAVDSDARAKRRR